MNNILLDINQLSAGYKDMQVLRDVSLGVRSGEMVVLIGPNGAGKSTVLKAIYGLADVFDGSISYNGKNLIDVPTHALIENGISFVPQGRLVFPTLTVEENLEMGGYLLDSTEALARHKRQVFDRFPVLREKRDTSAGHLSGGQQQQLAIGRALMTSPELLLLDEPSLGLSPKLMHDVFQKLEDIRRDGTSVFIVEQNVNLALRYVDRGYLLVNGAVRFEGSAEQLKDPQLMKDAYLT